MKTKLRSRLEVLQHLEKDIQNAIPLYLKPIDDIWQPADLLPEASSESFYEEVKELQQRAKGLSHDLLAVLVGDTITEEALPTYESWLLSLNDITKDHEGAWNQWIRNWTAEENRHGDVLNKYLYLSGRINMQQMEISTQYLLADGFDTAKEIEFSADINSINTNNEQRDAHLKSADFFNAEQHSQILFSGTKYAANGDINPVFTR